MPKYKVIYESTEKIYGIVPKAYDWVHYSSILSVKNEGKKPVSLEMTFVPPHPFMCNMPEKHSIKTESITDAYAEVMELNSVINIDREGAEHITIAFTLTPKAGAFFRFCHF